MAIWQTARVFISSTFRDMHAERDHLVRVVFPALRERLLPFRVELIDIDLRWGITRDQAEDDRVIDLCLQQSEECELFLGLLGDRYGWVPDSIPDNTLSRHGWLRGAGGMSVTEMEIRHAAINFPTSILPTGPRPAGFCRRDPAATATVPRSYREAVFAEAEPARRQRLAALVEEIESHNCDVLGPYPCRWDGYAHCRSSGLTGRLTDLDDFGRLAESWLWDAVRAHLGLPDEPPTEDADPLDEEREQHARFAERRRRHFVGRGELLASLADFAAGDGVSPCWLSGPSGSGKSATLAEFAARLRRDRPGVFVLEHYVGAGLRSASLRETLGRLCGELKREFGFDVAIPNGPQERSTAFRGLLASVPEGRPVVLVFDAPNQLDAEGGAHALHWLPEELPPHVKVVVGCIDEPGNEIAHQLEQRQFTRLAMTPLTDGDRRAILREVPKVAAKTLGDDQADALLANPAMANPLYLLVALEELRVFGSFDSLDRRIAALPAGGDALTDLFEQVFARLEDEFDERLVGRVLTSLGASRYGLSEPELRALTADLEPGHELFALVRQLRPYLLSREGRLDFYHANVRPAVERRYLETPVRRRESHIRLARHFEELPVGRRQVEELPWQMSRAEAWPDLAEVFADLDFLEAAWKTNKFEVRERWAEIETRSPLRMVDVYQEILNDPEPHRERLWTLSLLFQNTGQSEAASPLWDRLIDHFRVTDNQQQLHGCLGNQALIHKARGDHDTAMGLLAEKERICRQLGDPNGTAISLANQAGLLAFKRDMPQTALPLAEEAVALAERHGLIALAGQIRPILENVRRAIEAQ